MTDPDIYIVITCDEVLTRLTVASNNSSDEENLSNILKKFFSVHAPSLGIVASL